MFVIWLIVWISNGHPSLELWNVWLITLIFAFFFDGGTSKRAL